MLNRRFGSCKGYPTYRSQRVRKRVLQVVEFSERRLGLVNHLRLYEADSLCDSNSSMVLKAVQYSDFM